MNHMHKSDGPVNSTLNSDHFVLHMYIELTPTMKSRGQCWAQRRYLLTDLYRSNLSLEGSHTHCFPRYPYPVHSLNEVALENGRKVVSEILNMEADPYPEIGFKAVKNVATQS